MDLISIHFWLIWSLRAFVIEYQEVLVCMFFEKNLFSETDLLLSILLKWNELSSNTYGHSRGYNGHVCYRIFLKSRGEGGTEYSSSLISVREATEISCKLFKSVDPTTERGFNNPPDRLTQWRNCIYLNILIRFERCPTVFLCKTGQTGKRDLHWLDFHLLFVDESHSFKMPLSPLLIYCPKLNVFDFQSQFHWVYWNFLLSHVTRRAIRELLFVTTCLLSSVLLSTPWQAGKNTWQRWRCVFSSCWWITFFYPE